MGNDMATRLGTHGESTHDQNSTSINLHFKEYIWDRFTSSKVVIRGMGNWTHNALDCIDFGWI